MNHLQCPSCKLRISALGAPVNCPRCLVRKGERIELIASAVSGSVPSKPPASIDPRTDSQPR